jgi:hypothetical protein
MKSEQLAFAYVILNIYKNRESNDTDKSAQLHNQ